MKTPVEKIRAHLKKPIVMVGLMGAGKTKIGSLLAEALSLPFVDADHEIEKTAQCSIADIFEQYGEKAFRDLERQTIARLISEDLKVIATGGGAVMNEETGRLVWESSVSVWLRADLGTLVERTGRTKTRPLLLKGNPQEILQNLMEKRYPVYGRANIMVQTGEAEAQATLENVLAALSDYLQRSA